MDAFTLKHLQSLLQQQAGPCVSIYMETHPTGEIGQQDQVRLKNLLHSANEQLTDAGLRNVAARELLAKAKGLPTDPVFWNNRSHGLAIFLSPERFECYRLPQEFDEAAFVGPRFHIRPLLPLLVEAGNYFVLALSQNNVRLLSGSRDALETIDVPGLPENMEQALNYSEADRGAQVHSAMRGSLGKQAAVFHGQGGEPDSHKDDLVSFFRAVDRALAPVLRTENRPMLLAGVEYVLSIYRNVATYPHIVQQQLTGKWEHLSAAELHERAGALIKPSLGHARTTAVAKYGELAGTEKTSHDMQHIVPAAYTGQIETLFIDPQAAQWGRFDSQTSQVTLHQQKEPNDEDLLESAAAQTLLHGGTVYVADASLTQMPAAALLRY